MASKLDLTGDIASAVDSAVERSRSLVVGYVGEDGHAALSYRGSAQVRGPEQLAIWARKADGGIATAIGPHPQVSLLYYSPDGPGPRYLSFLGQAHVDPSANDEVYEKMVEAERNADPDRGGVAIIIDVDSVNGFGADGPFRMERGAA
jgi:hypothetical protein